MLFTTENKILIKHYSLNDKDRAKGKLQKFPNKPWLASGLDKLIKKIDDRVGTEYRPY